MAAYDDVAEEGNADIVSKSLEGGGTSPDAAASTEAPGAKDDEDDDEDDDDEEERPDGVVTAGKVETEAKDRKRAGKKKTGSQKKREKAEREKVEQAGPGSKRKRADDEEEEDRWVKLKLEGDQKPKRIDATRVVAYHDFDNKRNILRPAAIDSLDGAEEEPAPAVPAGPAAPAGNFRAMLRADLFAEESDEDDKG